MRIGFIALQLILAVRVILRMAQTGRGTRIEPATEPSNAGEISLLIPVLNEQSRLRPCLDGAIAQTDEVREILVIDGGSRDATRAIIDEYARTDRRVRLVDAAPVPPGVNGKAHGLQLGLEAADASSTWILTMDADVRPEPLLARSMLAKAMATGDAALSAATRQNVSSPTEAIVHASILSTLVYRFGIPGNATSNPDRVQANGQGFLVRRAALNEVGGFTYGYHSLCEDVTLARSLAHRGHQVGFYEAGDLVWTAMYDGWRDAWNNWPRSASLRDQFAGTKGWIGLLEVALVQAAPLPVVLLHWLGNRTPRMLMVVNVGLVCTRLGVLAGMARAYRSRPRTYWLSPLADAPVALKLIQSALQRRHQWRGQAIERMVTGERS